LQLLAHKVLTALLFARERAGKSMPAKMAMMAMTTSSSIKVKALAQWRRMGFMACDS
jgi:hypothetical protein